MLGRRDATVRVSTRTRAALLVLLVAPLLAAAASAQVMGAILTGTVVDPSDAAAPSAIVTIRNVETGIVTVVQTNAVGMYSAPNLLPGDDNISADAPGLASGELPRLTLTVGEEQILNIQFKIATIAETVDVHAAAGTVELGSAAISHVVDGRAARELPLNGRDWTQLAALEPGISPIRTQPDANGLNNRGNRGFGSQVTIAGGRPQQNNYRLDGVSINDYANSAPGATDGLTLGAEAIAQSPVTSSNYPASYGLTSGVVISAMTRAGVNDFHGSGYEFFRDDAFRKPRNERPTRGLECSRSPTPSPSLTRDPGAFCPRDGPGRAERQSGCHSCRTAPGCPKLVAAAINQRASDCSWRKADHA